MQNWGRLLAMVLAIFGSTATAMAEPVVATKSGRVSGTTVDGLDVFKGIPYAAAPIGEKRWRAPQPSAAWSDVLATNEFGPPCAQGPAPGPPMDLSKASEDCLKLNVWSPTHKTGERSPVLVIIPGGGFFGGASSVPNLDGAAIAKRGIVVVSSTTGSAYLASWLILPCRRRTSRARRAPTAFSTRSPR